MRQSFKSMILGGAILFGLSMCLTSCEDILGEWDRPTYNAGGGSTTGGVTSITLDQTTLNKNLGDDAVTLTATVEPADAPDKSLTWSSDKPAVATVADGVVTFEGPGTAIITATANDGSGVKATCTVTVTISGLLTGKFTINGDATNNQVQFSQGNLQYQASTTTWSFAENQYDCVGNAAGNTTAASRNTQADWIDLFGWGTAGHDIGTGYGTAYQPWDIDLTDTNYGPTDGTSDLTETYKQGDWGTNAISNGGKKEKCGWRTLTKDEWTYLLDTRTVNGGTGSGHSYTLGQKVDGKLGIVIYPDGYTGAEYTTGDDWATFENADCVFLPAVGSREGSTVYNVDSWGNYWSSSPYVTNASYAYRMQFGSGSHTSAKDGERKYGFSVRLVYDVQ